MARIRTIKPEFPQSESMGNVGREARLLFILLWPLCDDEGKARGSPRLLASLLFPYDADAPDLMDGWLDELARENCIVRYEAGGAHYVKVVKWLDHQKIDRPASSKFPDPSPGSSPDASPGPSPNPREASTNAREPSTNPREPSSQDQGSRKGPGKGPKDQGAGAGDGSAREIARLPVAATMAATAAEDEACRLWQAFARVEGWPEVGLLNSTRRLRLQARLDQCGGLEGWRLALEKARDAAFLRTPDGRAQRWFDLDWLLDEQKFTRLMEGRYAERHRDEKPSLGRALEAYAEFARETSG